jgi:HAD superfamily hydrolase (TIGR01458 family)
MSWSGSQPPGLLLDIDGVLHVGDEPLPGAIEALERLVQLSAGLRLVTNTTSKSRGAIVERLQAMGFDVGRDDVLTPAALAMDYCRDRGHETVRLLVSDSLREDLSDLKATSQGEPADAIVLGDLGDGFTRDVLDDAFRALMDGAELVALQHNRYWRDADDLVLDVGAFAAALEYAAEVEPVVVGKPSQRFFDSALVQVGAPAEAAVMVGDDVETDIGGALDAGIRAVLVRTGKYREDAVRKSGIEPTATIDSIADLPELLAQS